MTTTKTWRMPGADEHGDLLISVDLPRIRVTLPGGLLVELTRDQAEWLEQFLCNATEYFDAGEDYLTEEIAPDS